MRGQPYPGGVVRLHIVDNADGLGADCLDWRQWSAEGDLPPMAERQRFWEYVARMDTHKLLALRSGLVDVLGVDWCDPAGPYPEYPTPWDSSWEVFWSGLGKDKPCT